MKTSDFLLLANWKVTLLLFNHHSEYVRSLPVLFPGEKPWSPVILGDLDLFLYFFPVIHTAGHLLQYQFMKIIPNSIKLSSIFNKSTTNLFILIQFDLYTYIFNLIVTKVILHIKSSLNFYLEPTSTEQWVTYLQRRQL